MQPKVVHWQRNRRGRANEHCNPKLLHGSSQNLQILLSGPFCKKVTVCFCFVFYFCSWGQTITFLYSAGELFLCFFLLFPAVAISYPGGWLLIGMSGGALNCDRESLWCVTIDSLLPMFVKNALYLTQCSQWPFENWQWPSDTHADCHIKIVKKSAWQRGRVGRKRKLAV